MAALPPSGLSSPRASGAPGHLPLRAFVIGSVLLSAAVFALSTDGGKRMRQTQPLSVELDRASDLAGLGLFQLSIQGHRNTLDSDIYEALASQSRSLLLFDTLAARERIEQLPWVAVAKVRRIFPDEVRIDIEERAPAFVWRSGRDVQLLDGSGRLLGRTSEGAYASLPMVSGSGAAVAAPALFDEISRYPEIREKLIRSDRVGDRRWRLVLTGGRIVDLPETGWTEALATLARRESWGRLIDKSFAVLDLRVPGRVVLSAQAGSR